jgi:hypothetical protein
MTPGGIRTRDLSFHRRCNSDLHHGSWVESWRGTDDAVAALPGEPPFGVRGSNPLDAVAPSPRSNRHLHRRLAGACASAIVGHAGEQAISASVTATQLRPLRKRNCAGPRASPREAASRCVCQRRDSNPLFPVERSIRNLHHQRRFSRARRQTGLKTNFIRGALNGAATANPLRVRSAIGIRLTPRSLRQAPRAWARACRREPRDPGLPFRLAPGCFNEPAADNKKPSGAAGSGGSK